MAVTDIVELRVLPPFVLGRLGSSNEPMHNYDTLPAATPSGFRSLAPAPTLVVDVMSGEIVNSVTPANVRFRDGAGRIKPVAPFLELWARFTPTGDFEPVTLQALADLGLSPADVRWQVSVANLKMYRRTGDVNDRILGNVSDTALRTHARQEIVAKANNFRSGKSVRLGWAQYVKPTNQFPEIRLRFTPAHGLVFGHTAGGLIPDERIIYNPVAGRWDTHSDAFQAANPTPRARIPTNPSGIFASTQPPQSANRGFFDDSCDGIVHVSLTFGGKTLRAMARVAAGPPAFAPDSLPVRTVADDLSQMALGPNVTSVTVDEVIDIVRRAVENMRLLNTETQNASFPFWVSGLRPIFGAGGARYFPTRTIHESLLASLEGLKAPDASPARAAAIAVLEQMVDVLRDPDDVHDYRKTGATGTLQPAQRMPALMRGSDSALLALTRRQQAILRQAIEKFRPPSATGTSPVDCMTRLIPHFAPFATLHSAIVLPSGATLASLFATPSQFLAYLADPASVTLGPLATSLGFGGQRLVVPKNPAASALFKIVTTVGHPMKARFESYSDPVTGSSGVIVVQDWINSL